ELLRLVVINSSITLRKNPAASAISRKAGRVSTRKLLAPKFSTPIPIFCNVATLRSTHSASRGGNEKICGNSMRCDGTPCSSIRPSCSRSRRQYRCGCSRRIKFSLPLYATTLERPLHRLDNCLANAGRLAKTNFAFRRMDVDVYFTWIQINEQKRNRKLSAHE